MAALKGRPYVDFEQALNATFYDRVGAGFQPALAALKGRPYVDCETRFSLEAKACGLRLEAYLPTPLKLAVHSFVLS